MFSKRLVGVVAALLQSVGDVAASMGQAGLLASAARDLGLKAVPGAVTRWGFDRVMEATLMQVRFGPIL